MLPSGLREEKGRGKKQICLFPPGVHSHDCINNQANELPWHRAGEGLGFRLWRPAYAAGLRVLHEAVLRCRVLRYYPKFFNDLIPWKKRSIEIPMKILRIDILSGGYGTFPPQNAPIAFCSASRRKIEQNLLFPSYNLNVSLRCRNRKSRPLQAPRDRRKTEMFPAVGKNFQPEKSARQECRRPRTPGMTETSK